MTEEIIIDGVDVAECDYILSNLACVNKEIKMKKCIKLCANIPNCIIKNNLRLKQENEELKKYEYTYLDMYINLKQALKEIKTIAGNRFVSGLNEEADCYNNDMEMILTKINEVLK